MRARHAVVLAVAVVVPSVLGACGAPESTPAETIGSVPYDLLSPSRTAVPAPTTSAARGPYVVMLQDERLVAAGRVEGGGLPADAVARALAQLVAGPTEQDRAAGRATALGSDFRASLTTLVGARATVDIRAGQLPTGPGRLPLAVGQLVLTVTSVPEITEVVLTSEGTTIDAPLPGGVLTDRPLTAEDYRDLLVASSPAG